MRRTLFPDTSGTEEALAAFQAPAVVAEESREARAVGASR